MQWSSGDKIYVAGHRGLAGSALVRRLHAAGYRNLVTRTHAELDLTDQRRCAISSRSERPQYVFLAAAKVGGILANNTYPADFIHQNLAIQTNVIHAAWRSGVRAPAVPRLVLHLSARLPAADQGGIPAHRPARATNRPYAIAKIAGIELCWSYNRQYGTRFLAVMPTNLYGPGDNYDLQTSHVLPALIRKFHEAKVAGSDSVTVWGTGTPRREFLHGDDMADAAVFLANLPDGQFDSMLSGPPQPPLVNIGFGEDLTIKELAELVKLAVGFEGRIEWDASKPDGTPRKLLDSTRIMALGWRPRIALSDGVAAVYKAFASARGA